VIIKILQNVFKFTYVFPICNMFWAGHGSREVACFLFARSEAVTVGSNPTQGMDV
jgi:hypothetical protein